MKSEFLTRVRRLGVLAAGVGAAALIAGFFGGAADADTLRVGYRTLPVEKGNVHRAFSALSVTANMAFFDSLTYMDKEGKTVPGLITSWEARGPDIWIFKVREGVKFHNGEPFNAESVAFNINFLLSDEGKTTNAARQIQNMESARAIDATTVEIKMKRPNPILHRQAAIIRIVEPKAWSEGLENFAVNPVGTGTFRVTNWGPDRIDTVAFKDAWRKAKVDELIFIELPEVASRVQALASGQIDMALDISPDGIPQIESAGGTVIASPTLNILTLMINSVREGPLQDVRVRQALNYGVDKQAFVDAFLGGQTVVASQPVTRAAAGFNPDVKPYPYDPDKARALLADAGYANGLKLVAEVVTTLGEFADAFQHISSELKKVGVDLELKVITTPDLIGKILNQKPWKGDAFSMQYEGYPTADASRPLGTHSCNFFFDSRWTCEEPIMATINAANSEFDLGKREKLLQKAMAYYHDNATALYMYERLQFDAIAGNVKNYQLVNRTINWHEIELTN